MTAESAVEGLAIEGTGWGSCYQPLTVSKEVLARGRGDAKG